MELHSHLREFLNISSSSNELLGQDLASILPTAKVFRFNESLQERTLATHHVSRLCILLDFSHRLLLLCLELGLLALQFALSFVEGSLVLSEPFRGGKRAAEKGVLWGLHQQVACFRGSCDITTHEDKHGCCTPTVIRPVREDGWVGKASLVLLMDRMKERTCDRDFANLLTFSGLNRLLDHVSPLLPLSPYPTEILDLPRSFD